MAAKPRDLKGYPKGAKEAYEWLDRHPTVQKDQSPYRFPACHFFAKGFINLCQVRSLEFV